jgi:DNA-binding beta-propeller fold protein YncE
VLGAAAVVFAVCGALAGSAFGADAFTPASGSPVAVGSNPLSVAWSPDGKTVAVVNGNDHSLSVFSASPDGKLTPLIGSPIQTGAGPQAVAFSPDDAMIAVANASASTVSTYVVNSGHVVPTGATGTTAVPGGHGSDPVSVAFSPDGSLIATADLGGYISLLQNGSLSLVSGYPAAVDPNIVSLAWGPNGTIAAADGTSDQVSLYAVTQPGDVLSTLSISPLHTGAASNPRKVAFSHDGQWIAAADRDANQVSEWNLVTGAPASGSPFATGAAGSPVGIAYSPGSNLLAIGKTNGDVLIAAVGASGGLSNVPGDPYTIDATSPIPSVAFGRAGGLLAAVDENNDQLAMLTVAPPTIAITSPSSHELYQQNSEAHVAFRCADAEAGPGIASCTGTQANGSALDTSHLAPTEEIDVTATSADGQVTTQSVDYALTPLHLSLNVTPSQAGTSSKPVPVKAELTIGGGTAGVVDPGYVLDLPVGIVPQQAGYKGCSTADSKAATLPTTCDASIVATGQMKVDVSTNPVSECKLGLQLVAVAKSATLTLRVAPPSPAVPHCPAALTTVAVKAGTVDPGPPGVHMEMGFTLPGTLSGPADGTHFAFDRTPSAFSLSFPVTGTKSKPVSFFSSVACPTPSHRILGGPLAWSATVTNSGDTAAATSPCEPFAPPQHRSPTRSSLKLSSKPPLTVEGTVVHDPARQQLRGRRQAREALHGPWPGHSAHARHGSGRRPAQAHRRAVPADVRHHRELDGRLRAPDWGRQRHRAGQGRAGPGGPGDRDPPEVASLRSDCAARARAGREDQSDRARDDRHGADRR